MNQAAHSATHNGTTTKDMLSEDCSFGATNNFLLSYKHMNPNPSFLRYRICNFSTQKTKLQAVTWALKIIHSLTLTCFQTAFMFAVWCATLKLPLYTLAKKIFFIYFTLTSLSFSHTMFPVLLIIYFLIPNCQSPSLRKQCNRQMAGYCHCYSPRGHSTGFYLPCHFPSKLPCMNCSF